MDDGHHSGCELTGIEVHPQFVRRLPNGCLRLVRVDPRSVADHVDEAVPELPFGAEQRGRIDEASVLVNDDEIRLQDACDALLRQVGGNLQQCPCLTDKKVARHCAVPPLEGFPLKGVLNPRIDANGAVLLVAGGERDPVGHLEPDAVDRLCKLPRGLLDDPLAGGAVALDDPVDAVLAQFPEASEIFDEIGLTDIVCPRVGDRNRVLHADLRSFAQLFGVIHDLGEPVPVEFRKRLDLRCADSGDNLVLQPPHHALSARLDLVHDRHGLERRLALVAAPRSLGDDCIVLLGDDGAGDRDLVLLLHAVEDDVDGIAVGRAVDDLPHRSAQLIEGRAIRLLLDDRVGKEVGSVVAMRFLRCGWTAAVETEPRAPYRSESLFVAIESFLAAGGGVEGQSSGQGHAALLRSRQGFDIMARGRCMIRGCDARLQ
ncbi:hypothetical protein D3C71_489200 [compost metagenome]